MSDSRPGEVLISMLHAIDRLDWPIVRASFADRVRVDYSSLSGQPAADVSADDLIAGWKTLLPGFDATQHLAGPVLASQENATAVVETHVRGYHHIADAKAGEIWMVAGHYTARLSVHEGDWKIVELTLTLFYQEGNLSLPDLARSRAVVEPRESRQRS